jgi:hypothetical protein
MAKITRVITRGFGFLRKHGLGATYRAAARRFGSPATADGAGVDKALPYGFAYEPVSYRHGSDAPGAAVRGRINWVIPDFYGASVDTGLSSA